MTYAWRRVASAGIALAASLLGVASPVPASPVAAAGAATAAGDFCASDTGVTVVVDMTALGGDIIVRCADGPVGAGYTGLDALGDGGFSVEGTENYGLAFVCRIEGQPTEARSLTIPGNPGYHEECATTPPQSAYWAYSFAPNGGSWTYSSAGAANHAAIPGGFEGWTFSYGEPAGAKATPDLAPQLPAASTSPTKPPRPTSSGGGQSTGPTPPPTSTDTGPSTSAPSPYPTRHPITASSTASDAPTTGQPTTEPPTTAPSTSSAAAPTQTSGQSGGAAGAHGGQHGGPGVGSGAGGVHTRSAPPSDLAQPKTTVGQADGQVQVTSELPGPTEQGSGSAAPTVIGLGVLVVLGLGAGLTAWWRSRRA